MVLFAKHFQKRKGKKSQTFFEESILCCPWAPLLTESTGGTRLTVLQAPAIAWESSSHLPYTAGSGGKQLHVVMRGEDHAHLLLPWRLKEIKVPAAQQGSCCVTRRDRMCSQAGCIKDEAFSRRWLPASSYLPSPSRGPWGSTARTASLWAVGGTVGPVVWACAHPQGREVSASAGTASSRKESFQCLIFPSLS